MGFLEGRRLAVGYGAIASVCFGFFGWLNVKYPATYTLLWPGAVYSWVALSYLVNEPRLIGFKDPNTGYLNKLMVGAMFPFYALVWAVWYTRKVFHGARDPSSQHIIGRWYIGRQPLSLQDLPPDTGLVVDLTAEFGRLYSLRKGGGINYLCTPSLDTSPPALSDRARFAKCLREAAFFSSGNVFVHCANGHGRSAAFLVGMMVVANVVPSISEGEKLLKSIRPTIKIRAGQKKFLEAVLAAEAESRPPGGTRGVEISASETLSPSASSSSATELLALEKDNESRAGVSSGSSSENLQISTASSPTSSPATNPSSSRRRLSGPSSPSNDRDSSTN